MPLDAMPIPQGPLPPDYSHLNSTIPLKELKPNDFAKVPINELWTMYYRHHHSVFNQKMFHFKGDLKTAIERAKKHASIMGYRLIFVTPLVVDIDYEERWKIERGVEPLGG